MKDLFFKQRNVGERRKYFLMSRKYFGQKKIGEGSFPTSAELRKVTEMHLRQRFAVL